MQQLTKKLWYLCKRCMRSVVTGCLHLFGKELDEAKWEAFLQFVKFLVIGASNTLISYIVNIITLLILGHYQVFLRWDYMIANVTSFILSVLWSFYWNNKYVFNLQSTKWSELLLALLKMYLSYAVTGIVMTNILSYVWVDVLGISKYIAPLINYVIGVPINFLLNKFWAFKETR